MKNQTYDQIADLVNEELGKSTELNFSKFRQIDKTLKLPIGSSYEMSGWKDAIDFNLNAIEQVWYKPYIWNMTETLHIYTRVSSITQEEDGTSLETQKELGITCAKKNGFNYKIWNEGAQSSAKDDLTNRPVLTQLLDEITNQNIQHLSAVQSTVDVISQRDDGVVRAWKCE